MCDLDRKLILINYNRECDFFHILTLLPMFSIIEIVFCSNDS